MKTTASGRILFWRGGSLWIGLAGEPTGLHAHHAIQISLPFPGGRVRLQGPSGHWVNYSAALVTSHHAHAFEARSQLVAQIFVDPETQQGRELKQRHRSAGIVALPVGSLADEIGHIARAFNGQGSDEELVARARALLDSIAGAMPGGASPADPRIVRALELVRQRIQEPIPLKTMAEATHLSPDRFRHLFMQETGVGFRAYLLWLRLECSLAAYVAGASLTDAAHTAGFADSAHLSRTFRRMFGIAPASIRLQ